MEARVGEMIGLVREKEVECGGQMAGLDGEVGSMDGAEGGR